MSRALALSLALLTLACNRRAEPGHEHGEAAVPSAHGHAEASEPGHEGLTKHVTITEDVVKSAGIRVTRVTKETLAAALVLPGEIAGDPDRMAEISSPAAGRIDDVRFKEGDQVKRGAVLAVIRVPEIAKVRATLLASQTKAKAAQANAERLRSLLAERLAAEQQVVDAEAEARALELEARSSSDQLGALGAGAAGTFAISLRAPIDGTIIARRAVVGQPVTADQTLGALANLDEVWFLARVFEKDLGQLKLGAAAEVHLNAYPDQRFAGSVEYVGQQIDAVARTVTARVRLKNRDGLLRLGLFGTGQVSKGTPDGTGPKLVVGRSSVTEIGDKSVVFVRTGTGEFELHEVTLGREALGKVEVLGGLRDGEEVVSDGVFTLKSVVLKGSFAEDDH